MKGAGKGEKKGRARTREDEWKGAGKGECKERARKRARAS